MSRIGKMPITIPKGVKVQINGAEVSVNGPLGKLSYTHDDGVAVNLAGDEVVVSRVNENRQSRNLHGLTRSLINNMVIGVSAGFTRNLEVVGVGYRAEVKGSVLVLNVGYSNPVELKLPAGIKAEVDRNNRITLRGFDKQLLGQFAANVRAVRPPEPYKGKGIKYAEEILRRKVGKTSG